MKEKVNNLFKEIEKRDIELMKLYQEVTEARKQKDKIEDKKSEFYKEKEGYFNDLNKRYNNNVKNFNKEIDDLKKDILEENSNKMRKIDKANKELKEKYIEIKRKREALEGAKGNLKYLKSTLTNTNENKEIIEKEETKIENLSDNIEMLKLDIQLRQDKLQLIIPDSKDAEEYYLELQEESKIIDDVNFKNYKQKRELLMEKSKDTEKETDKPDPKKDPAPKKDDKLDPKKDDKPETKKDPEPKKDDKLDPKKDDKPETKKDPEPKKDDKPDPKKDDKLDPKKETPKIVIDASKGKVIFEKSGSTPPIETDLADTLSRSKRKAIFKKALNEAGINKETMKVLKKLGAKSFNPALLQSLLDAKEPDLIKSYLEAKKDGKEIHDFEVDAKLDDYTLTNRKLHFLNSALIKDNKTLGTNLGNPHLVRESFLHRFLGKDNDVPKKAIAQKGLDAKKILLEDKKNILASKVTSLEEDIKNGKYSGKEKEEKIAEVERIKAQITYNDHIIDNNQNSPEAKRTLAQIYFWRAKECTKKMQNLMYDDKGALKTLTEADKETKKMLQYQSYILVKKTAEISKDDINLTDAQRKYWENALNSVEDKLKGITSDKKKDYETKWREDLKQEKVNYKDDFAERMGKTLSDKSIKEYKKNVKKATKDFKKEYKYRDRTGILGKMIAKRREHGKDEPAVTQEEHEL